jgi:hypothetical protein
LWIASLDLRCQVFQGSIRGGTQQKQSSALGAGYFQSHRVTGINYQPLHDRFERRHIPATIRARGNDLQHQAWFLCRDLPYILHVLM